MSDLDYSVAEEIIQEKTKTNNNRRRIKTDKLKAERAKDYIRFPAPVIRHPVPDELQIDLRRIKKLSDIPEE